MSRKKTIKQPSPLQILTHLGALLPLAILVIDYWNNDLTVNPIQEITFRTGRYALILLILSLACTPLNFVFGWRQVIPLRKPLGLYAFSYAALHFLTFIGLDYGFDLSLLGEAIFEKWYALVGFTAFIILLALTITSTNGWMRRLGKNWKRLHQLVYPAALLAIIHFVWLVKADIRRPLMYGAVVVILLVLRWPSIRKRIVTYRQERKQTRATKSLA